MRILFTALALILSAVLLCAANCSSVLAARDAGWYNDDGYHDPLNVNYFTGYQAASQSEFRNWFLFDIPTLDSTVVAAELRLYTFAIRSTNNSETLELHDVGTPVSILTNGGTGLPNVFEDLGDGLAYGTRLLSITQSHSFVSIPLNANALAVINNSRNQPFAVGGRVANLPMVPPYPTNDIQLFGFSYPSGDFVQLILSLSSTTAPKIVAQPPPTIFAASGSAVSLDVVACGAGPIAYRWFFNEVLQPNQMNPRLTISNVTSNHAGSYFAIVSNQFGDTTTAVTRLLVDVQPATISVLPGNATVEVGAVAQFNAVVQGSPRPHVEWRLNGSLIPGATNGLLIIPNAQFSNAGTYTITVTNLLGSQSHSATLKVEPLLLGGPANLVLDPGTDGLLSVVVGSTLPRVFQWRRSGTNISAPNSPHLPFFNASASQAGNYDVVVANSAGARTSRLARVTITNSPPRLAGPASPSILFGSPISLSVQAGGSEPMRFQWYHNGVPLPFATNAHYSTDSSSIADEGDYFVVASNTFGVSTSATATVLLVNAAPISESPDEQRPVTVFVGDAHIITHHPRGGPMPTLQWIKNVEGENIPGATKDIPGATNATLFLPNVGNFNINAFLNLNAYYLIASNVHGAGSSRTLLLTSPRLALDQWTWRNPLPQGNDLDHVTFANGRYIAGGHRGTLVTSTNALDWSSMFVRGPGPVRALTARDSLFAALVGKPEKAGIVFLSVDGLNWFPQAIPGFTNITSLEFINEELHAFGDAVPLVRHATSTDGVTWTTETARGLTVSPESMAFGNGRLVTASPTHLAVLSGGVYREQPMPGRINRVRFLNGQFVALDSDGIFWRSPDGSHWTPQATPLGIDLRGAAYGEGRFVVVGESGTLLSSETGDVWTPSDAGAGMNLRDVLFEGGHFVASGHQGALLTSANGLDWTERRRGFTNDLFGIVYTNGLFVAVGLEGIILTSPNGKDWTARDTPVSHDLNAITYSANQFVTVGQSGTVLTSPDGSNWTRRVAPTTQELRRIAYGNGRFVALGSTMTILNSADGVNWNIAAPVPLPANAELEGLAFGEGKFVAVGAFAKPNSNSVVLLSTNGVEWFLAPAIDFDVNFRSVAFGDGRFFAGGNAGITAFSTNGIHWREKDALTPEQNVHQVVYGAGRYITLANGGELRSRAFLDLWPAEHGSRVTDRLHDITFGLGTFVAVGEGGIIIESGEALPKLGFPRLVDGWMHFSISGGTIGDYYIEASENLRDWETVAFHLNEGSVAEFAWPIHEARRFLRLRNPY